VYSPTGADYSRRRRRSRTRRAEVRGTSWYRMAAADYRGGSLMASPAASRRRRARPRLAHAAPAGPTGRAGTCDMAIYSLFPHPHLILPWRRRKLTGLDRYLALFRARISPSFDVGVDTCFGRIKTEMRCCALISRIRRINWRQCLVCHQDIGGKT